MEHLILTPDEKKSLISLHKSLKDKRLADRVKCVILLDSGYNHTEIAEILLLDDRTINRYKSLYFEGIDKLLDYKYKGRIPKLSADQEKKLSKHLENHLYRTSKEIVCYIKTTFGINFTSDGLVITLHRLGFSYKKTKSIPSKADRVKQKAFIDQYKSLRANLKPDEKIYFLDGVHPTHNAVPGAGWIKKGKEKSLKTNSGRQRLNINGVYSPLDQEVIYRSDTTINSQSTIELFKMIETSNLGQSKIYVIADNARYHHSKLLKEYLLDSKIEMIYLPPYSPNLNLIERLWKILKEEVIYNKYHEMFSDFRDAIYGFFDEKLPQMKEQLKSRLSEKFKLVGIT